MSHTKALLDWEKLIIFLLESYFSYFRIFKRSRVHDPRPLPCWGIHDRCLSGASLSKESFSCPRNPQITLISTSSKRKCFKRVFHHLLVTYWLQNRISSLRLVQTVLRTQSQWVMCSCLGRGGRLAELGDSSGLLAKICHVLCTAHEGL